MGRIDQNHTATKQQLRAWTVYMIPGMYYYATGICSVSLENGKEHLIYAYVKKRKCFDT